MSDQFFSNPILNSPYDYPGRHWELDDDGQPTQQIIDKRRTADFITPIPAPQKRASQQDLMLNEAFAGDDRRYKHTDMINSVRLQVDAWRKLPESQWRVTATTARLLKHWRHHQFSGVRPFFCQVEAVETVIWLTEVAPSLGKQGREYLDYLNRVNKDANPELLRLALKLATGAGKTTVMALLIAWQTLNAVRQPTSKRFTRGFLIVAPGITIKDRLRVLQPHDPDSYYQSRELVPLDLLGDLGKAKIVITNYHAFKLREKLDVSKGTRAALEGWREDKMQTQETEGEMLQRVVGDLMGLKNILVLNDEAHHCYREKPGDPEEAKATGDEKKEADENREAARLWISGLEAANRKLGISRVIDLSATPFFLRGSGYVEGTLFPWVMSDFSLMDAIECGIVKLPRVPVADNIPGADLPIYRNLWEHIGKSMPKKGRGKSAPLDPHKLPSQLQTALQVLYGHYEKVFDQWEQAGSRIPPCFIVVCNNTSSSKLVYDYISGFHRELEDGSSKLEQGRLDKFSNFDSYGQPLARPHTLLIDSQQLESGEALDKNFKEMAAAEIEQFRREVAQRHGSEAAKSITDQDLLREVLNTVGKEGKLGGSVRCVVSVSMLTEGWDANNVTHVLGVRAFGTQLLCEQVMGRALRRQSYELNKDTNCFDVEYAEVLGIPFDFTAADEPVAPPPPPPPTFNIRAVLPERQSLEIRFPRVLGYRTELPQTRLEASFTGDSVLELTPNMVGATHTKNAGIIGEDIDLNLQHLQDMRRSSLIMNLTNHLLMGQFRDPGEEPKLHLFGQLKRIVKQWLDGYLHCIGDTYPAQLMYKDLAEMASERIAAAIHRYGQEQAASEAERQQLIKVSLDPYNPWGSTSQVNFTTRKESRWATDARKCQINEVVLDSDWEAEFCRVAEQHERVLSYVKNHSLGFEIPYQMGGESRRYIPDFILQLDDGGEEPLNLIVEIKGYRGEDAKAKAEAAASYWVPGVNNSKELGRWAFAELKDVFAMQADFAAVVERQFSQMVERVLEGKAAESELSTDG